ncbi:MAG: hypothetical protein ACI9MR_003802 [Myxococcota bacterium]|jgi:hypothetical protein
MKSLSKFLVGAVASLCVVTWIGLSAQAAIDLRRIAPEVAELPFGEGIGGVTKWVQKRIERTYAPAIKAALDNDGRAKLRAQRDREVFEFRDGLIRFDGKRTGFEVSLVAGEYGVGSKETMLRFREHDSDHYFFFADGKFWKYARALAPEAPFANLVAKTSRDFGKPSRVDSAKADPDADARPIKAVWSSNDYTVRVADRRTVYGQDLLVVIDRRAGAGVAAARSPGAAVRTRPGLDPDLEQFLLKDGETLDSLDETEPAKGLDDGDQANSRPG